MRALLPFAAICLALLVFAAACLETQSACAQEDSDIVSSIPWADQESADYLLLDPNDGEVCGTGTLSISRTGDQYELSLRFESDGNTDVTTALVDAETLQPAFVRRERLIDGISELVTGEYDDVEKVVRIVEVVGDDRRELPRRLDEERYFDNETSLFLWRTIRFEEGYETSYETVLVNQGGSQRTVRLRVDRIERITVPAGTFDAWRVEIVAGEVDQLAWFTQTPEHYLLQYHNSLQIFQLSSPIE